MHTLQKRLETHTYQCRYSFNSFQSQSCNEFSVFSKFELCTNAYQFQKMSIVSIDVDLYVQMYRWNPIGHCSCGDQHQVFARLECLVDSLFGIFVLNVCQRLSFTVTGSPNNGDPLYADNILNARYYGRPVPIQYTREFLLYGIRILS